MTSSGYGSQAVSTLTLSSDDSISVKSMEEISESTAKSGQASASLKRASTGASTDSDADDANGSGDKTNHSIEEEEEDEDEAEAEGDATARGEGNTTAEEGNVTASSAGDGICTEPSNVTSSTDAGGEQDPSITGRTRSDSLLDEQVPDIKDSPLKPAPSPSINSTAGQFFSEQGSARTDPTSTADVDSDPYSVTAMEELERLGEEEEEGDISIAMEEDSVSSVKTPCQSTNNQLELEQLHNRSNKPAFEASTPKEISADKKGSKGGSGKKRGSGMRPRPMSMVVSPQAEVMTRAWQDDINRRSSLHLSEDSLAGMLFRNCLFVF